MRKKITTNNLKYVTMSALEKAMVSVAKSFSRMDERFDKHDKAFELILKQNQKFREEGREHRQTMSSLKYTDIKQERELEDLKIRVERLETRVK